MQLFSVKYICSEEQKLPRIFYSFKKTKNFQMNVPFMYNFRSLYRTNSLYDFLKFNISHFTPQVKLLSVEKGT